MDQVFVEEKKITSEGVVYDKNNLLKTHRL